MNEWMNDYNYYDGIVLMALSWHCFDGIVSMALFWWHCFDGIVFWLLFVARGRSDGDVASGDVKIWPWRHSSVRLPPPLHQTPQRSLSLFSLCRSIMSELHCSSWMGGRFHCLLILYWNWCQHLSGCKWSGMWIRDAWLTFLIDLNECFSLMTTDVKLS